jgi:hypothetical protein
MAKTRIIVQFEKAELEQLRKLARENQVSVAELVRRAVKLYGERSHSIVSRNE